MPTYCYSIKSEPAKYNENRCPSWCDRIVFRGEVAKTVVNENKSLTYQSYGEDIVIGDHKPVSVEFPFHLLVREKTKILV
ncbi:hypothetical protein HZS_4423 [Henneguya salminicola]|nr:hypothetical protein HZS_4423 [Henneguya salminicola]